MTGGHSPEELDHACDVLRDVYQLHEQACVDPRCDVSRGLVRAIDALLDMSAAVRFARYLRGCGDHGLGVHVEGMPHAANALIEALLGKEQDR